MFSGGNLALRVALDAIQKGKRAPLCVGLLSPWIDLTCSGDSYFSLVGLDPTLDVKHFLEPASKAYTGTFSLAKHCLWWI